MFVLPLARATSLSRSAALSTSFDRVVDRLFDESFDRYAGAAKTATRTPALDVLECDTAYTLAFDVPGAARETLKVSVEGRRVSLTTASLAAVDTDADADADAKDASPAVDVKAVQRPLYRERAAPVYARTVSLPAEVDQQTSHAKFENGVLTLVLAKKVRAGAIELQIA
jgi:HSP20 family protein